MNFLRLKSVWMAILLSLLANSVSAETVFIEAETMQASSGGCHGARTKDARSLRLQWGS